MAFNKKMYGLGSCRSIIREIFEYSKARAKEIGADKVFDFSLGNPSVPAPCEVNEAIRELLDTESSIALHGYTSAQGDLGVRSTVAGKIKRDFGIDITPDHIYMTCGAAASLSICLRALIEPEAGEECIVFAPFFTEYRVFIENAGGKIVVSMPKEADFQIDPDDLKAKINERTKAVIINSPNNPCGVVYSPETLRAVCDVLKAKSLEYGHEIYLIADEPYRELVYTECEVPYLMNYYDNTLVCYSYSKSLSLPGERIGYIAVCPTMSEAREVYLAVCGAGRSLGYVCAPSLFQRVAARCIDTAVNLEAYRENRNILYNALTSFGYECVRPDGAFYLLVKSPFGDARTFFERAKAHEVLVVPCDDFGIKGYVRVAYCVAKSTVENSLPAFEKIIKEG